MENKNISNIPRELIIANFLIVIEVFMPPWIWLSIPSQEPPSAVSIHTPIRYWIVWGVISVFCLLVVNLLYGNRTNKRDITLFKNNHSDTSTIDKKLYLRSESDIVILALSNIHDILQEFVKGKQSGHFTFSASVIKYIQILSGKEGLDLITTCLETLKDYPQVIQERVGSIFIDNQGCKEILAAFHESAYPRIEHNKIIDEFSDLLKITQKLEPMSVMTRYSELVVSEFDFYQSVLTKSLSGIEETVRRIKQATI